MIWLFYDWGLFCSQDYTFQYLVCLFCLAGFWVAQCVCACSVFFHFVQNTLYSLLFLDNFLNL